MPTNAIPAHGTLLKIGDGGGPETFTTISEVRELSGPEVSLDTEDVTSHDSTDGWEEVIGTILRSGEVSATLNYVPTDGTHDASTGVINDMQNRTLRNFEMVFPDSASTTWSFAALVTNFGPSEDADGILETEITLKLSGKPTLV